MIAALIVYENKLTPCYKLLQTNKALDNCSSLSAAWNPICLSLLFQTELSFIAKYYIYLLAFKHERQKDKGTWFSIVFWPN